MKETEITVQVFETLEDIDRILKSQGFQETERFSLDDFYFTTLNDISAVSFEQLLNKSILVREVAKSEIVYELMFKKKYFDEKGNVVSEEKTKAHIDNFENTLKIMSMAGLNNYLNVKNNSIIYEKDDKYFCLQIVDDLGIFIEYEEDQSVEGLAPEEKIVVMSDFLKSLGLRLGNDFSCKKVEMLLNNQIQ